MATLERRIEMLEAAGAGTGVQLIPIRKIVRPGELEREVTTATIAGQDYDRGDESEQEFIARLTEIAREWRRTGGGPVSVICSAHDLEL